MLLAEAINEFNQLRNDDEHFAFLYEKNDFREWVADYDIEIEDEEVE